MYVGRGAVDKGDQSLHLLGQVDDLLGAPDVDGDGGAERVVEPDRGRHVKDHVDLALERSPVLVRNRQACRYLSLMYRGSL